MHIYGIAGMPLGHSLSPLLHNWAFRLAGIRAVYTAWPLGAERIGSFVSAVRTLRIRGASLTIPLKEAVLPLPDALTERARRAGAVNTLYWEGERLCGDNTDIAGFTAPLRGRSFAGALLLGAGGAARAVPAGLLELGLSRIAVTGRNFERARRLAEEWGLDCLEWEKRAECDADLFINATPLGMRGAHEGESPLPPGFFAARRGSFLAYDLVYSPPVTRFLAEARAAGGETLSGLDMFIAQAQAQFRLWTGRDFSGEGARSLLMRALGARA
jgi:shikimate dehydrogenase